MQRARILLVEDEPIVAMSFATILQDEDYDVIGPAPSIDHALEFISGQPPLDGALLDINVRAQSVTPVADALEQQSVPFAFVTGYGQDAVPERFRAAPLVQKPCRAIDLLKAVRAMRRHG
jgi:CheY-like chemotaxis protein